jgi:threonyl-tRNA synthetase
MVNLRSTILSSVRWRSRLCLQISSLTVFTVVGEEEMNARAVNVRNRDDVGQKTRAPTLPLDEVVMKLVHLKATRSLENKL